MSNGLNAQFNINECIVKSYDGKAIAIAPHKNKLYEMNFIKVHRSNAVNLV